MKEKSFRHRILDATMSDSQALASPSRRSLFRPCIDLHDGKVKQIVGGTLSDATPDTLKTNFVARCGCARVPKVHWRLIARGIVAAKVLLSLRGCTAGKVWRAGMLSSSARGMTRLLKRRWRLGRVRRGARTSLHATEVLHQVAYSSVEALQTKMPMNG